VALAVLFLTMMWPRQTQELERAKHFAEEPSTQLLWHRDAYVRAAACELAGLKSQTSARERVRELASNDGVEAVRTACAAAGERLR
jgi:hypothetical protein